MRTVFTDIFFLVSTRVTLTEHMLGVLCTRHPGPALACANFMFESERRIYLPQQMRELKGVVASWHL
jgi:hypothetical protein